MYKIAICIVILKFQLSTSQFPSHTDLQKVGEIIFNNEIYNVLKPSTHVITDYFKDFMLRRKSKLPTKRVFIDDNGFRHFWSGFETKSPNLRKTDVDAGKEFKDNAIEEENETTVTSNENDSLSDNPNKNDNNVLPAESNEHDENVTNKQFSDNETTDNNQTIEDTSEKQFVDDLVAIDSKEIAEKVSDKSHGDEATAKPNEMDENSPVEQLNEDTTEIIASNEDIQVTESATEKATPRRKKRMGYGRPVKSKLRQAKGKAANTVLSKTVTKQTKNRTLARTTFFCPYFGVMTMSAFID